MKDKIELRITQDGSIESIYQDGLAEALGATTQDVKRASNVEFENFDGRQGWTVRSASDPQLAIRTGDGSEHFVGFQGTIVTFNDREEALAEEVMFFWELLGWEKSPCPTHNRVGCMTCRYGEPPDACPVNCQGIDLGDGNWSGCSCNDGVLANGQPQPEGWKCDCPQHTGPNPCKEIGLAIDIIDVVPVSEPMKLPATFVFEDGRVAHNIERIEQLPDAKFIKPASPEYLKILDDNDGTEA